jgi:hypothetical protein
MRTRQEKCGSRWKIVISGRQRAQTRLRDCLKIMKGAVFAEKAVWRGATKENIPCGSSTEEQRSQTAFSAKTLRAAGLFACGLRLGLTAHSGMLRPRRLGRRQNSSPQHPSEFSDSL